MDNPAGEEGRTFKVATIVTNNELVRAFFSKNYTVVTTDTYLDVLCLTRDLVHRNYRLLTHPQAGSMKPNQTPYRSIALEEGTCLDWQSLHLIENAIATTEKFFGNYKTPEWSPEAMADFRTIDLSFMTNALQGRDIKSQTF